MNSFTELSTKYTAVYRCVDNISNFKIRIKIREKRSNSTHTSGHTTSSTTVDDESIGDSVEEVRTFNWQEKVFGKYEREYYRDEKNCISELDHSYHEKVLNLIDSNSLLYTHTSEDDHYKPSEVATIFGGRPSPLQVRINSTALDDKNESNEEPSNHDCYNFESSLESSLRFPVTPYATQNFYIMVDFGEYVDTTWLKFEYQVCAVKYCSKRHLVTLHPDFTRAAEPYVLRVDTDTSKVYEIFIEDATVKSLQSIDSAKQLRKKLEALHISQQLTELSHVFERPPPNTLRVNLRGIIDKIECFEMDSGDRHVYVEYCIDLPEGWSTPNLQDLGGETQHCRILAGDLKPAHFGFSFDVCLDFDMTCTNVTSVKFPCIYFEVTSKLSWNRYRSEGVAYNILPVLRPGRKSYELSALRLSGHCIVSQLRRHFIGDYKCYNDVRWFNVPLDVNVPAPNNTAANVTKPTTSPAAPDVDTEAATVPHSPVSAPPPTAERGATMNKFVGRTVAACRLHVVVDVVRHVTTAMTAVAASDTRSDRHCESSTSPNDNNLISGDGGAALWQLRAVCRLLTMARHSDGGGSRSNFEAEQRSHDVGVVNARSSALEAALGAALASASGNPGTAAVRSMEQVLADFRAAKAKMLAARKNI